MRAACFSVAAMDYFPQKNQSFPGGNALNQTLRLAELGIKTSFLGALGTDESGDKIYGLLAKNHVDLSQVSLIDGVTANNRIINDDLGERYGVDGAWQGGVFEQYRISEDSWAYISDFSIWTTHASCPNFLETLSRKSNNTLCVDYLHLPDFSLLKDTLAQVDIAYVGGDQSMQADLAELSKTSDCLIVLTLGGEGSMAFHSGKKYSQPAFDVDVVDTTGCGDAFQAGFTNSYTQHQNIEEALLAGATGGRLAAMHYGGSKW